MPPKCTICEHEKREEIDRLLVQGGTMRTMAHQYGVSNDALKRHKKSHLPKSLTVAKQAESVTKAEDLFSQIDLYKERLDKTIEMAEKEGDFKACMSGFKAILAYLEFLSKLRGELPPENQVNVQVVVAEVREGYDKEFRVIWEVLNELGPEVRAEVSRRIKQKCPELTG